ncbi:MAG: glucose-1-phosphate thymidylyltransferase [Thermoplasmata archaeon]|nr:glucose-1-phosphate thymidylyltransferase [Thermoplasmata archaeon]
MKGLLLAGGHGTRLRPLTFTGNKHMIPIANQPMLFYGLRHLAQAGIREVGIILGTVHEGIEEAIGDGRAFGLEVTYIHQGDPRGLADAVRCARSFLGDEPFVMYLGDNLLQQGALPFVDLYERDTPDAVVGATVVADPRSYGVVELGPDGSIVSISEKPAHPKSNLALIGVYLFTPAIHDVVAKLKPSARGEFEITDAIWALHGTGAKVAVQKVEGWWKDTGRPEDLLEANERVLRAFPRDQLKREGTVESGAEVRGGVALGLGTVVRAGARIHGPAVIGSGCEIGPGAYVGPATALGNRVKVVGASVRRSILLEGATISGPLEIVDSILGRESRVVAQEPARRISCILGDATMLRL